MNIDDNEKKTVKLNIQLSATDKEMLERMKKETGKGMGTLIREAITARFRMRYNNEPSCADCTACKCPQMHQVQSPNTTSNADLLAADPPPNGPPA